MSSAPSVASQFQRHILIKIFLSVVLHLSGRFLFFLQFHQLHKDGVYSTRINLRDIPGGWVNMVFIPRRPGVWEIGLSGPVKHRLIETGIPIGKLDGAGEDIDSRC